MLNFVDCLQISMLRFHAALNIVGQPKKEKKPMNLEQLKTESAKESGEIAKLQVIQARYAEKNGFAVQGN